MQSYFREDGNKILQSVIPRDLAQVDMCVYD
jgi:hypothetical protein